MTIILAVEALNAGLGSRFGCLTRSDNWLVTLLRASLLSLLLLARLLEFNGLVDHEYSMLLLDLNLSSFQHGEQLRRGLSHPLHVVVQHKAFVARGQRLQYPINCKFIRNLAFQSIQMLNVARHFDHVLTNTIVLIHLC